MHPFSSSYVKKILSDKELLLINLAPFDVIVQSLCVHGHSSTWESYGPQELGFPKCWENIFQLSLKDRFSEAYDITLVCVGSCLQCQLTWVSWS